MKLSVIIASFNRSQSLLHVLQELSHQIVPEGVKWEVLIVDNNSTDGTESVISQFVSKDPKRYRYLRENRQGKSHALNTGIHAAAGEIVVFTDDDCISAPNWLCAISNEFVSDPALAILGGRVELYCKDDRPVTIRTFRERILFSKPEQLFSLIPGCNMSIKKSIFDVVGEFDPLLGPGTKIGAVSEDTDFIYRVFKKGFKVAYSPDVLVYHNHGRRTEAQVQSLNHKYVVGRGAFYCKHILKGDVCVLRMAYWEVSALIKGLLKERFSGALARQRKTLLWDLLIGMAYAPSAIRRYLARRFVMRLLL
jgi:glycosyltransferase involved in cell wall biosynthesis